MSFDQTKLKLTDLEIKAKSEVRVAQDSLRSLERVLETARTASDQSNDVLRISVARVSTQIGQTDLAVQQYKYLIKHSRLLDDVVSELQDLIADSDDAQVLQRLHRTLGDAYSKQGRLREAVEQYSWTLGGPRGAR